MARRHPYSCVCYCGSSITFVKMAAGPKPVTPSRRRDCHLTAPPCAFSRWFNRDKQGGVAKMAAPPTASTVPERGRVVVVNRPVRPPRVAAVAVQAVEQPWVCAQLVHDGRHA